MYETTARDFFDEFLSYRDKFPIWCLEAATQKALQTGCVSISYMEKRHIQWDQEIEILEGGIPILKRS